ncbi:hypothetical protein [Solitalea koreensis]|uniref:Uncharacterized protein n=1 Tax=Solitalea koreensis TaxID=543615 RepID=A0A521APG8_9SPHI|nr:hypothetical protein [Solitalea koreensis]SMO36661.1 hypothetical protein SAMN06265350_101294 [Solitalea koreensis]
MHELEPYYNWRDYYVASEDKFSPFYNREYSEFYYDNTIYNFYIHPQWDSFGSSTLYIKVLFVDYHRGYCIIEMIGEWNDCINNDIMLLKRDVLEFIMANGINKFILIGENILNFHASDDSYYEEWFQEVEEGWIAAVNFREHVSSEMKDNNLDYYLNMGGELDDLNWRALQPIQFYKKVEQLIAKRLN